MIEFKAVLGKFKAQGEKTGWTYFEIPAEIATKIKPNFKKSFRVHGKLDHVDFKGVSLLPMGEGNFIMPVKAELRKQLKKLKGYEVNVKMEEDTTPFVLSYDMLKCLREDKKALAFFKKLAPSHQKYYSNWIESAKTAGTKAKRIAMAMHAFSEGLSYAEMLRENRENKV